MSRARLLLVAALVVTGCAAPVSRADRLGTRADRPERTYTVTPGGSLLPHPGHRDRLLWRTFTAVAGRAVTARDIETFTVGYRPNDDEVASVEEGRRDGSWIVRVNDADIVTRSEVAAVLVHEQGHLVTLSSPQVDPGAFTCDGLDLPEGCAGPASYLGAFADRFWQRYGEDAMTSDVRDDEETQAFHDAHPNDFVTEYAASSPVEDFAETWQIYVFDGAPTDSGTVADKLRFMDDQAALRAERTRIRSALAALGTTLPGNPG